MGFFENSGSGFDIIKADIHEWMCGVTSDDSIREGEDYEVIQDETTGEPIINVNTDEFFVYESRDEFKYKIGTCNNISIYAPELIDTFNFPDHVYGMFQLTAPRLNEFNKFPKYIHGGVYLNNMEELVNLDMYNSTTVEGDVFQIVGCPKLQDIKTFRYSSYYSSQPSDLLTVNRISLTINHESPFLSKILNGDGVDTGMLNVNEVVIDVVDKKYKIHVNI